MIYKKEVEDFVEEAMKYGYIDYDCHEGAALYYKDCTIVTGFDHIFIRGEISISFESNEFAKKLKPMLKSWEAI